MPSKLRLAVTIVLLLFVGVSLAYLAVKEIRPQEAAAGDGGPAALPKASGDASTPPGAGAAEVRHKVIAYYFHGTKRCKTCLAIEALARETLSSSFASEMSEGTLEWSSVDIDEPAHEHFVDDYALPSSSLVLVDFRDGKQTSFAVLSKVWDLIEDPPAFESYVQEEATRFLGKQDG